MVEWISVQKELPEKYQWVLVKCMKKRGCIDGPNIFVAYRGKYGQEDDWDCAYGDGYIPEEIEIRYWAKLPD